MGKLFHTLVIAALALALPLAASAQTNLNLDTGATGGSGTGDITFTGTGIAVVGSATQSQIGDIAPTLFVFVYGQGSSSLLVLEHPVSPYSTAAVTGINFIVNDVIAVHTNGGNYAAMLVTALSGGSITLQYITYNASGAQVQSGTVTLGTQSGPAPPSIGLVQNNYSFILPGAPNYGIAPGALILIQGTGLTTPGSPAVLPTPPATLPTTLNGSQVAVTVNGTTVNPAFYYACDGHVCNPRTQLDLLAVVLPSTTPVGTGTLTVTYGQQTSPSVPITIVPSAFGFDFYDGALAAVTDNHDGHLITASQSAYPGEVIVFWGSGDGADTNNTDVSPPAHFDNLSGITALYIGGVQVPIVYQGRSTYQGVDQIAVTVPANAPTGCAVSVVGVIGSGSLVSATNLVTMPIGTSPGICVDPLAYVSPTLASTLAGKSAVRFGGVSISESTNSSATEDAAGAFFWSIAGSSLNGYNSSQQPSLGSCVVTQSNPTIAVNPFTLTGLDAGSISVQGPSGTEALTGLPSLPGDYLAQLPLGWIPASGGTFTFTGTGGSDVGAFSAAVSFPNPVVWTNSGADGTVVRASGAPVTWTGGAPGTYVQISGNSVSTTGTLSASFTCNVPATAQSFTVPPAVLLQLPAGSGSLELSNYTNPTTFTASGLDYGFAAGIQSTLDSSATYR